LLLQPLAPYLDRERVVIVADGALHYVPFAALPDPRGASDRGPATARAPLIARHEVVFLPSAKVLEVLRANAAPRKASRLAVAVLADPVFEADDPRVRPTAATRTAATAAKTERPASHDLLRAAQDVGLGSAGSLPRLPFSRQEAEAIAAVAAPGSVLRALDFDASRATALSSRLADYRIVHFATHGFVDDERPDLSGLVLSMVDAAGGPQDGFLRLRDVSSLRLPVELVVLSGCRTGLGREIRGEGMLGIVRAFMYAGAPRVVASAWDVDDRATAALMKEFYRAMMVSGRPPAAALRQAQLAILSRDRWQDPFYWAAFMAHGEWN
jgi:CHAT domain-containing protein